MRTIEQASAWLREMDPATALTSSALRRMVVSGRLPHVMVGKKYLLDLDRLETYLFTQVEKAPQAGKIRPVEVGRK